MASDKKDQIFEVKQILNLLTSQKREENLTPYEQEIFSLAVHYFGKTYFFNTYSGFLKNLPTSAVSDYIDELEKEDKKKEKKENKAEEETKEEEVKEPEKPQEQENSIPPELESLLAEYRLNQELLNQEVIAKNRKKTVAEQIKIAQAHAKIRRLAELNRQRLLAKGQVIPTEEEILITLGAPKTESKTEALAPSFAAVKTVAFTYAGFVALPPEIQNQIITQAVELNLAGVTDLDIAIQSTVLEIDTAKLPPAVQTSLATIPSNFVSSVHQEILNTNKTIETNLAKIEQNEIAIVQLEKEIPSLKGKEKEAKQAEIATLVQENTLLTTSVQEQPAKLATFVATQTETFISFETNVEHRHSKNPDLPEIIAAANNNVAIIHNNLESHGVKPHLFVPLDDAILLEDAIRADMPGVLEQFASQEAEQVAALIDDPKTQDPALAPQAVLLYSKGLDPKLFSKVRQFAIDNPDSTLGKLFTTRKDIFDAASTQIKSISLSPLAQQIQKVPTIFRKFFKPATKYFGKTYDRVFKSVSNLSSRIPGGFGNLFKIASDPVGAFKSWAGKKVGKYILGKFLATSAGKATEAAARKLASKLLTEGAKKAIVTVAAKLGIKLAIASTGVGAIISLAWMALDLVIDVAKKFVSSVKNLSREIYGEEIKTRDVLAAPVLIVSTVVSGIATAVTAITSATVAATSSALTITIVGAFIGLLFYITSIATAPLLSTLVQLDGTYHPSTGGNSGAFCSQDVADRAKEISDNLQKGFNQYYNKSPDYPELWNPTLFAQDPNPIWQQDVIDWDDMFWCNWLVVKSFTENGKYINFSFTPMIADFTSQGVYLDADEITISDICPGMAVFFKIPAGSTALAHVAVVYSVSVDGFTSVESNAPYKTMFYPVDSSGHFQIVGTIKVASFGSL